MSNYRVVCSDVELSRKASIPVLESQITDPYAAAEEIRRSLGKEAVVRVNENNFTIEVKKLLIG